MTAYADLPLHVQAVVDRQARALANARRIPFEQARESIAKAVVTTTNV